MGPRISPHEVRGLGADARKLSHYVARRERLFVAAECVLEILLYGGTGTLRGNYCTHVSLFILRERFHSAWFDFQFRGRFQH